MLLWMQNKKAKLALKRIKIAIAMKKGMSCGQTEGCDKAIDGFADRVAPATQHAIILCGRYGQIYSSRAEHLETAQLPAKPVEG